MAIDWRPAPYTIIKMLNSYGVLAGRMGFSCLQYFIAYGEGELFESKIGSNG
jgi:hypothetical protein